MSDDAMAVKVESAPFAATRRVSIWTVTGGYSDFAVLEANADVVTEFNPCWFDLSTDGSIEGAPRDARYVEKLRGYGMKLVPTIGNAFDHVRTRKVIGTTAARTAHCRGLLALVKNNNFDGLDVDYEALTAADKENFSLFIEELASGFRSSRKLLSIAVHPKQNDQGGWGGPQAQDYARLGRAVDSFKVMTYDYSGSGTAPGPIAPLDWVKRVVAYTVRVVPAHKVSIGLPAYGYEWSGLQATSKTWIEVQRLIAEHKIRVRRDASNEGYFTYGANPQRTIFFNDGLSVKAKIDAILSVSRNLAGFCIWRLGGEDSNIWTRLRSATTSP